MILRYAITGGIAMVVAALVIFISLKMGASLTLATIIAFPCSWMAKFILHKFWTFNDRDTTTLAWQTVPYASITVGTFVCYIIGAYGLQWLGMRELYADITSGIGAAIVRYLLIARLFVR